VLVGSVLVDVLLYVDRLPERGGDKIAHENRLTSGGGFNVLVGAKRLGLPVAYAGKVGEGPCGNRVAQDLATADIPLLLPRVPGEDTGFTVGLVEADGERTFITSPGAESRLTAADLTSIQLKPNDAVYVSGYDLCYPVSGASLAGWLPTLGEEHLLVFDPGPLAAEISEGRLAKAFSRVDLLSLNAREARLLTGEDRPREAAHFLLRRLPEGARTVVRAGEDGCWVADGGCPPTRVPARAVRAVDATGAGDAHFATLLARLAAGDGLLEAARVANVAAAIAVSRPGPAMGPTAQELEEALELE
jgi:sugar/nucleoside kinase (ribokinase family)